MAKATATPEQVEMDQATKEFLERVSLPVGEETARERFERVQAETKAFLTGLKDEAKEQDKAAKNRVVTEVIEPAFKEIIKAAEEFTGLTVRRLSCRYTNGKDEEPEFKFSHTINKARESKSDSDES